MKSPGMCIPAFAMLCLCVLTHPQGAQAESKTTGGVLLNTETAEKPNFGTVVAVGECVPAFRTWFVHEALRYGCMKCRSGWAGIMVEGRPCGRGNVLAIRVVPAASDVTGLESTVGSVGWAAAGKGWGWLGYMGFMCFARLHAFHVHASMRPYACVHAHSPMCR